MWPRSYLKSSKIISNETEMSMVYILAKQIIFMYHSADFKYEDSVLRYMDLKCGIHSQHS